MAKIIQNLSNGRNANKSLSTSSKYVYMMKDTIQFVFIVLKKGG